MEDQEKKARTGKYCPFTFPNIATQCLGGICMMWDEEGYTCTLRPKTYEVDLTISAIDSEHLAQSLKQKYKGVVRP